VSFWHNQNSGPAATVPADDQADAVEGEVVPSPAESPDEHSEPSGAGYGQDAVIGGFPSAGDGSPVGQRAAGEDPGSGEPAAEATEPGADGSDPDEPDGYDADSDVVVAEVIDVLPDDVSEEQPDDAAIDEDPAVTEQADVAAERSAAAAGNGEHYDAASLSPQWHDIQASFVDDPRTAVDMAAQAADAALSTLVSALRERQSALVPAGVAHQDTEQLRMLLREYRSFCAVMAELQGKLPQPSGAPAG
jgi:hypothetical protein